MLNRQEIKQLIEQKALITDYFNLDIQLTPNGFDLTAGSVSGFLEAGALDFSNQERVIPKIKAIKPEKKNPQDKFGWWHLKKGAYKIITNETINLSDDLMGIAFPRSSLLRSGVFIQTAVWDAGFRGKSEFILVVQNPYGLRLKQNARVIQLTFLKINKTDIGYQGVFQDKNP